MSWLRVLETWLTYQLIRSPTFQRAVQSVHRKVLQRQHKKDLKAMGRADIEETDPSDTKKFIHYYMDELKEQIRGMPPKK